MKILSKIVLSQIKQYVKGSCGWSVLHCFNLAESEQHFPEFLSFHNIKCILAQRNILHEFWKGSGAVTIFAVTRVGQIWAHRALLQVHALLLTC